MGTKQAAAGQVAPATRKHIHGFQLGAKGHPTSVDVVERTDGTLSVALISNRQGGLEPLVTSFTLTPTTVLLLSSALNRAAHDPGVWLPIPDPPSARLNGQP